MSMYGGGVAKSVAFVLATVALFWVIACIVRPFRAIDYVMATTVTIRLGMGARTDAGQVV